MDVPIQWLVRMRWAIALAQLVLVGLVLAGIAPAWPVPALLLVCGAGVASNLALGAPAMRTEPGLAAILLLDTVLLTVVLVITGGSSSPFSALYLVPVMLAAFTLRPVLVWIALGATAVEYAGLFAWGPAPAHHHGPAEMQAHVVGMFLAYAFAAPLLAVAVARIRDAQDEAARELATARAMELRSQHLTALATLAAGASHELMTPLSTILLVAGELERASEAGPVHEDALLIRQEVNRCKEVLEQLSVDAGAGMAESEEAIAVQDLLDLTLARRERFEPVGVHNQAGQAVLHTAPRLVAQALRRLLGNARDAQGDGLPIELGARIEGAWLELEVVDRGCGMDADTLERAREPFFTTKALGEGTGLGLYFVSSVASHLRGELQLESAPGEGTRAVLRLPLEAR